MNYTTLDAFDEFANSPDWRRSEKLNLWRRYNGLTVSIFAQRRGGKGYNYCIADGNEKRFDGPFQSEDEAMYAAFVALEGSV